jgi:hemerythrin
MSPPALPVPSFPTQSSTRLARPPEEMNVKELDMQDDQQSRTLSSTAAFAIRERIALDHALLRSLTRALLGAARAAEEDEKQRYVIREILRQLLDEIERHFEYEERVTAPLLRRAEGWGPICAHRMAQEHAEQRTTLHALAEDSQDGVRTIAELADEIRWFFRRFEQDMSDEEERLVSACRFETCPPESAPSRKPAATR